MNDRLGALSDAGISIWLDDMSRDRLASGNLVELINDFHVSGATSNPSIFAAALSGSELYDDQLRELKAAGADVDKILTTVTTDDIRDACDVFADLYKETNGVDGRVSIEVDPRHAHELEETIAQAHELHKIVGRDNAYIKIPATKVGLAAIESCTAAGIDINVTLIFSVDRYREVLEAYLSGLEQAHENGVDISKVHSVASVFVSRNDVEVDKRLEAIGTDEALALRGKAALAVCRLCHEVFKEVEASDRWAKLAKEGGNLQRPLWASTGTKNPEYSDVLYVEDLVTAGCVNTMPEATLKAFADHGEVKGDMVSGTYDASREVVSAVEKAGVDMADVFQVLEDEAVEKFIAPWEGLIETLTKKLETL